MALRNLTTTNNCPHHKMDEETKLLVGDFIIHNDEEKPVIPQVRALHDKPLALSKEKK